MKGPMLALIAALGAGTGAAAAQEPLSAEAFEAIAQGMTLHFERGGFYFGAEQFLSGRRSLWRYPDGRCEHGRWFEAGALICFLYEETPGRQCWQVTGDAETLEAELHVEGIPTGEVVRLVHMDAEPLPCPGPRVGS